MSLSAPLSSVTAEGIRRVRVVKLFNASRGQRITIVPIPHFAWPSFYKSWYLQPYFVDHHVAHSRDIYPIMFRVANREAFDEGAVIAGVDDSKLPTAASQNLTLKQLAMRSTQVGPSRTRAAFEPLSRRARNPKVFTKNFLRLLGPKDVQAADQYKSIVTILTETESRVALDILTHKYEFAEEESVWVDVGPHQDIAKMEAKGHVGSQLLVFMLWLNLVAILAGWFYEGYLDEVKRLEEKRTGGNRSSTA